MEYHTSCGFDSVKVYDNAGSNKTLLGSFCGFDIPPPLQSTTSKMTVVFTSDYVMQFEGFNVTVEFTNTKGKYVVFSCDHFSFYFHIQNIGISLRKISL